MCLAHLVDDAVGLVLEGLSFLDLALVDMLVHGQIQFGHDGIGAADAAVGADDAAGNKLLIRAVEDHEIALAAGSDAGILEHLDVLGGHGAILDGHHVGVLQHFLQQAHGQCRACQLGDVVDDEIGVGGSSGHGVPILGDGILRQVEVDRGDGGNGVHAHALGVFCQLDAVGSVVAADMGNDGDLALGFTHHGLQDLLALIGVLVDALTGRTADIHALDALGDQVAGEGLDALHGNVAVLVIAGIERRDDTLILGNVFHDTCLLLYRIMVQTLFVGGGKPKQQARALSVRATGAAPSCGALHPLRPLGGPCVLQTAAPKIPPCFRRRRRSGF